MIFSKHTILTALRNLQRNKRRTVITGIAILSGYVGLNLLAGYVARVERNLMVTSVYLNHTGHVQIYKTDAIEKYFSKPRKYLLSPQDVTQAKEVLAQHSEVIEFTTPYLLANGLLQVENEAFPFQGKAVTPEADAFTRQHPMVKTWTAELEDIEDGTSLYNAEKLSNPIKITFKLSDKLNKGPTVFMQGLTVDNSFNALEATVASTYSTGLDLTEDTSLMTTLNVFQELLATDGITNLGVYLKSDLKARGLSSALNEEFKKRNLALAAYPFFDERISLFYTGTMNFLYAMAAFFFSLVSLVVILSIANAISMNIIERAKELGTMRAIGFTPERIAHLIAWESFILSVGAIVIGFFISQIIALLVNAANIRFYPPGIAGDMQFVLTPWPSICFLLAIPLIALAVVTAYVVTKKKIKVEVINLLSDPTT
jgi:putative ABC transport system permease protein